MINPPDDLLADLQSALPPEHQPATTTPPPSSGRRNQANGHCDMDDHFYNRTSHELPPGKRTSDSTVRVCHMTEQGEVSGVSHGGCGGNELL